MQLCISVPVMCWFLKGILLVIMWWHASILLVLHISARVCLFILCRSTVDSCKHHVLLIPAFNTIMTVWRLNLFTSINAVRTIGNFTILICLRVLLTKMLLVYVTLCIFLLLWPSLGLSIVCNCPFETGNVIIREMVVVIVIHNYLLRLFWDWSKIGHWVPA